MRSDDGVKTLPIVLADGEKLPHERRSDRDASARVSPMSEPVGELILHGPVRRLVATSKSRVT